MSASTRPDAPMTQPQSQPLQAIAPDARDPLADFRQQAGGTERQLHAHLAERQALGLLLQHPQLLEDPLVDEGLFFAGRHREIFMLLQATAVQLIGQGQPVQFGPQPMGLFVHAADAWGPPWPQVVRSTETIDSFHRVQSTVGSVDLGGWPLLRHRLLSARSRIEAFRAAFQIQTEAIQAPADTPAEHLLGRASEVILHQQTRLAGTGGTQNLGDGELDVSGEQKDGYRCGFLPNLMKAIWRFEGGRLYVFGGRSGVGKSALLLAMAVDAAVRQGIPAITLGYEMKREELKWRAVANVADLDENFVARGGIADDPELTARFRRAEDLVRQAPLTSVDLLERDIDQAIGLMRQWVRVHARDGRGAIFFDYIKLLGPSKAPWDVLGTMARKLKAAAVELDLPVVTAVQLNRGAISMRHADFAEEGQGAVAGADKIVHESDFVALLRDLRREEQQAVAEHFGLCRDEPLLERVRRYTHFEDRNLHRFNQGLYRVKGRAFSCGEAIPMHYYRGRCRFQDYGEEEAAFLEQMNEAKKGGGRKGAPTLSLPAATPATPAPAPQPDQPDQPAY